MLAFISPLYIRLFIIINMECQWPLEKLTKNIFFLLSSNLFIQMFLISDQTDNYSETSRKIIVDIFRLFRLLNSSLKVLF